MREFKIGDFYGYRRTCPIDRLEDKSVTFVRSPGYTIHLVHCDLDIYVFIKRGVWERIGGCVYPGVKPIFVDDPYYHFVLYHNEVNEDRKPKEVLFGRNCNIHPSAILGIDGLRVGISPSGELVQMKHMGGIVIGDEVEIGAYSTVNRGVFGDTEIRKGVKIGAMCRVGDGVKIGENSILTSRVDLNGGVEVGGNCWLHTGTVVASGVTICNKVVLGIGSVVVRDILEPGIYVGNPARYLKPFSDWRSNDRNIHL